MTIPYHITVGQPLDNSSIQEVKSIVSETFDEIDRIYNKWNPKSELSLFNQSSANNKMYLTENLYTFLVYTETFVTLSNNRFDPTIEPLEHLWKENLSKKTLPSEQEISQCATICGWSRLHLENGYAWKDYDKTSVDLGGIAKGYAIDLITERLVKKGYENLFVEWGGEIRAHGMHPDDRPWRVMVTKWGVPGDLDQIIELSNCSIASSGDYLQNWTVENQTYCHIIDPIQRKPLLMKSNTICSVTVVAEKCTVADTLATGAMLFLYPSKAKEWLECMKTSYPEIKYWIFTRNNSHNTP